MTQVPISITSLLNEEDFLQALLARFIATHSTFLCVCAFFIQGVCSRFVPGSQCEGSLGSNDVRTSVIRQKNHETGKEDIKFMCSALMRAQLIGKVQDGGWR